MFGKLKLAWQVRQERSEATGVRSDRASLRDNNRSLISQLSVDPIASSASQGVTTPRNTLQMVHVWNTATLGITIQVLLALHHWACCRRRPLCHGEAMKADSCGDAGIGPKRGHARGNIKEGAIDYTVL